MKTIKVYTRYVYGRPLVYAAIPEQAEPLATLTGAKTLESRHITALQRLGFTVELVPDPASVIAPLMAHLSR